MPRIKCHYENCKFVDNGFCNAPKIEMDPFDGCMTYVELGALVREGVLEDGSETIEDGWEVMGFEDDDDFWLEDDEDT